VVAGVFFSEAV
jgi:hypothetical protein